MPYTSAKVVKYCYFEVQQDSVSLVVTEPLTRSVSLFIWHLQNKMFAELTIICP